MATGPVYRVPLKRRRKQKTDYRLRLGLLKSGKERCVIRKSNYYITASVVKYAPEGDKCLVYTSSNELKKYGWSFSGKNLPACYLTGYLCGKKLLKKNIKEVIPDLGRYNTKHSERLYATIKGIIDSGVNLPCDKNKFPAEERIKGEHIKAYGKQIKERGGAGRFSQEYNPEKIPDMFEKVKAKIDGV